MKVCITHIVKDDPIDQHLQDVLNWPDLATLADVEPHVTIYLDQKYGAGNYELVGIEEVTVQ